jgi:hypothetical protein
VTIAKFIFATLLMCALGPSSALASPLIITNVGGDWINPTPLGDVDSITNQPNQLTDSIYWGGGANLLTDDSGYQFTPVNPNTVPLNTPFLLGNFVHINEAVWDSITGVQYAFGFATNGTPNTVGTTFQFNQDETPNAGPCPDNPVTNAPSVSVCDDFVQVSNLNLDVLITVGTDVYYFNLLGFSDDGGATFSSVFQTQEGRRNRSELYGEVTSGPIPASDTSPVPEPTSLCLLGTGLAFAARRAGQARKQANTR